MSLKKIFGHTAVIIRHRHKVFTHCLKCGIPWRGFVHDLSKFTPAEFFESVKYYTGKRSPIGLCRERTGVSFAWLHHKGRNKHHIEYWIDDDCDVMPMIPYKYAVECICDKIAATKIYRGKDYNEKLPLEHWERYGNKAKCNPKSSEFFLCVFRDLANLGEKAVLNKKYMKTTYKKICT